MERWRFNTILAVAYLLTLIATGCSNQTRPVGEQTKPEIAPKNAQENTSSPDPDRPVIVAFGDSLTAGVVDRTYPDYLQEMLDNHGYPYRVENQGVGGDTTTDGLARIDNVLAQHPALVLLEFGGNDGLRGTPANAIRKNLEEMITKLQAAHIPLVLLGITLPPNYGADYVQPFTAMYPALAKKYKIPVIPFLLSNVYQHTDWMQPDGIHPNAKGNQVVAEDVFKLITPMLQSKKK